MDKEKVKSYDLNLKVIFFSLVVCIVSFGGFVYIIFFAPLQEVLHYQLTIMRLTGKPVCIGAGLLFIPYILYLISLLIYKRKNVLTIYESKIEYYGLLKGRIIINKKDIKDIYISKKLVVKYKEKNKFEILNINLLYIKCNKNEIRESIINFKQEYDISKNILINILKEYKLKDLTQLKEHKEAFEDCVIKFYNTNEFTQQEIASVLNTNSTKVSKIIGRYIKKL